MFPFVGNLRLSAQRNAELGPPLALVTRHHVQDILRKPQHAIAENVLIGLSRKVMAEGFAIVGDKPSPAAGWNKGSVSNSSSSSSSTA
jgi:hypothetical protein